MEHSKLVAGPNPYVGPRPFEEGRRIYGRERETSELYYLLTVERVALLHSPSGAGKSSLIYAGLIPRLRERFDVWKPTRVSSYPGTLQVDNRYAWSAAAGFEEDLPEEEDLHLRRSPETFARQRLANYVNERIELDLRPVDAPDNIVLIFDQFEELLRVDPLDLKGKRAFFEQLGELLRNPRIWALFVVREDYLAPLHPYAQLVPTHLRHRYRIDHLSQEAAVQAVQGPTERTARKYAAGVAESLVADLAKVQVQQPDGTFVEQTGLHVEPVQLQVVCRGLWDRMPPDDISIDPEDVEDFGDVTEALAGYYAESVRKIANDPATERAIRDWFGEKLIAAGEIRGQVLHGQEKSEGLANELIEQLLDTHLVRAEQRAGATWYELAHDRLIKPVLENNAVWHDEHLNETQKLASLWVDQGEAPGLLLLDDRLRAAESWAAEPGTVLTQAEQRFVAACRKKQAEVEEKRRQEENERRQARRIRYWLNVATIVGCLALVTSVIAAQQCGVAYKARERAAIATEARDELFLPLINAVFPVAELLGDQNLAGAVKPVDDEWTTLIEEKIGEQRFGFAMARKSGEGRVLAAGHDEVLKYRDENDENIFLKVVLMWLRGEREPSILMSNGHTEAFFLYGQPSDWPKLKEKLGEWGHSADLVSDLSDSTRLAQTGVLIIDNAFGELTPEEIAAVERFVSEGGGLLVTGLGWSWQEDGPDGNANQDRRPEEYLSLDDYPMNKLMSRFGMRWTDQALYEEQ